VQVFSSSVSFRLPRGENSAADTIVPSREKNTSPFIPAGQRTDLPRNDAEAVHVLFRVPQRPRGRFQRSGREAGLISTQHAAQMSQGVGLLKVGKKR
jgi:hypothetical protein